MDCWEGCTPCIVFISHWLQVCLVNPTHWYSLAKWIHPQQEENDFAGLLVGITSVTVSKSSFFIYQLSVIAPYVIYRRDKCYLRLANGETEARSVGLVWGHHGASNWKSDSSRPVFTNVNCLMALVLSYWSQLLQGALVHKQILYLKITFQEWWALTPCVTFKLDVATETCRVSCSIPLLFDQFLLLLSLQLNVLQEIPNLDWICWLLAGASQELDCEEQWFVWGRQAPHPGVPSYTSEPH